MNRRNLLKTFLAAPAIIRSGVLMPVVPLVAGPSLNDIGDIIAALAGQVRGLPRSIMLQADRVWVQDHAGRKVYDTGLRADQWTFHCTRVQRQHPRWRP